MTIEQFFKIHSWIPKTFWVIVGIAGVVGAIYGVRTFYRPMQQPANFHPDSGSNQSETDSKNNEIRNTKIEAHDQTSNPVINAENSVISLNQSGGITAKTVIRAENVNIEPIKRRISHEQLKTIIPAIKEVCSNEIRFMYAIGDKEQKTYAEALLSKINRFLDLESAISIT